MSGLEVVGVVASILQLADIGAKLSVKLCSFYRTVKVEKVFPATSPSLAASSMSSARPLSWMIKRGLVPSRLSPLHRTFSRNARRSSNRSTLQLRSMIKIQIQIASDAGPRKITAVFLGPDLDVLKSGEVENDHVDAESHHICGAASRVCLF